MSNKLNWVINFFKVIKFNNCLFYFIYSKQNCFDNILDFYQAKKVIEKFLEYNQGIVHYHIIIVYEYESYYASSILYS